MIVKTWLDGDKPLSGVVIFLDGFEIGTTAGNPVVLPINGLSAGTHNVLAVYGNNGREQKQKFLFLVDTGIHLFVIYYIPHYCRKT